ncbi:MAG: hypothetical protein V4726_24390 [Verrucomicrobiota bacterium]
MHPENLPQKEPTTLEIATLAARFLPQIDLNSVAPGQAWHPLEVERAVGELTSGKGLKYDESYKNPQGWKTPFEIIAEEAVRRARILLEAAAGQTRPAVLDYATQGTEAQAFMESKRDMKDEMRRANYARIAKGRSTVPLEEILRFALPKVYSNDANNAWMYFRNYLRSSVQENRKNDGLPELEIVFSDKATAEQRARAVDYFAREDRPSCIVLPHGPDYEVNEKNFADLVLGLRHFHETYGGVLKKRAQRSGSSNGGKITQAEIRESKITREENARLEEANKRHSLKKIEKTPFGA